MAGRVSPQVGTALQHRLRDGGLTLALAGSASVPVGQCCGCLPGLNTSLSAQVDLLQHTSLEGLGLKCASWLGYQPLLVSQ